MRHEISQSEAVAIHKARRAAVTCQHCSQAVAPFHYCPTMKWLDEQERRAGTR